jgi:hypothetical protein
LLLDSLLLLIRVGAFFSKLRKQKMEQELKKVFDLMERIEKKIDATLRNQTPSPKPGGRMNQKAVAEMLNCNPATVKNWIIIFNAHHPGAPIVPDCNPGKPGHKYYHAADIERLRQYFQK